MVLLLLIWSYFYCVHLISIALMLFLLFWCYSYYFDVISIVLILSLSYWTYFYRRTGDLMFVYKVLSFLDVLLKFGNGRLEESLLEFIKFSQSQVLLNSVLAEEERCREVGGFCHIGFDVSTLDHVLLALQGSDKGNGESSTGVGHRKGGRTSTGLGFNDLKTIKTKI